MESVACPQFAAGQYSAAGTLDSCTNCGVNTYSSAGAESCASCVSGRYSSSGWAVCEPVGCSATDALALSYTGTSVATKTVSSASTDQAVTVGSGFTFAPFASYSGAGGYPATQWCTWRLVAPVGFVISVTITSLDTGSGQDYLSIVDGPDTSVTSSILVDMVSGTTPSNAGPFVTTQRYATVLFNADSGGGPNAGFVLTYDVQVPD